MLIFQGTLLEYRAIKAGTVQVAPLITLDKSPRLPTSPQHSPECANNISVSRTHWANIHSTHSVQGNSNELYQMAHNR